MSKFKPGDEVIYRVTKRSTHPGPRATEIRPAKHGDSYTYHVEKFWRVKETRDDGSVVLFTRRGKERVMHEDDPNMRRPGLIARLLYAKRFPQPIEQS
jgi:hypothetical protein